MNTTESDSPHASDVGRVLFISHNAADRPFALALEQALVQLADGSRRIDIRFSTSDEAGPQGGEKWRDWIYRQVVEAHTALIVVSPHALGKPWLLWEAGACWGAALARREAATDPASGPLGAGQIVSVAFGINEQECPDPLRGDQIVRGDDEDRMALLFERMLRAHGMQGEELVAAIKRLPKTLPRYLTSVRSAMLRAPSLVNEANVQDWIARLQDLEHGNRLSELGGFKRWLMLAFGRDVEGESDTASAVLPIDVRLHRRLGELHLGLKQFEAAIEQLRLAWRLAPRDIYVLRPLAEASMKHLLAAGAGDAGLRADLQTQLAAMQELDPKAHTANPDAAALYAKYLRRVAGNAEQALTVLTAGLSATPDSYYLADLAAQTQLDLGDLEAARRTYEQALAIIGKLKEQNLWTHATAAAACLALDRAVEARSHVVAAVGLGMKPAQLETIENGLREVARRIGTAADTVAGILQPLAVYRSSGEA